MKKFLEFLKGLFKSKAAIPSLPTPIEVPLTAPQDAHEVPASQDWHEQVVAMIFQISSQYLGWRETQGNNRSPQLDAMILRQGGKLGQPYCVFGIQDVDDKVCDALNASSLLPETGSSQKLWAKTPAQYKATEPQPGYIAVFQSVGDPTTGHGAIVRSATYFNEKLNKRVFDTREFNTDISGDRDGSGVFDTHRFMGGNGRLKLLGFIKWPEMIISKGLP